MTLDQRKVVNWTMTPEERLTRRSRLLVNGCLEFQGNASRRYKQITVKGHSVLAHRFAWTVTRGPIPAGLTIDHLCDNPACVNTEHMALATLRVNVLRGNGAGAINARRTACQRGHPFDRGNTLVSGGQRYCRACLRRRAKTRVRTA